jgi:uncharacterized protein
MKTMVETVGGVLGKAVLCAALCSPAVAMASYAGPVRTLGDESAVVAESDAFALKDWSTMVLKTAGHPNEYHRLQAAKFAAAGDWNDARKAFLLSARYAYKYSQHRLSLLYWYGVGTPQDRVEAYVWADLAAERGYQHFLAIREKMWRELRPEEQAAVAARGRARYAEYGDPAAKRRFELAMGWHRRSITGSRTGHVGTLGVLAPKQAGTKGSLFDNRQFIGIFSAERTDPKKYWALEDRAWKNGMVSVGEIEPVKAGDAEP